jgi:hypothetical protein
MPKLKYFGSHISDNIQKTDEGYIVCKNVPIARTGWQTYAGRELGKETQEEHNIGDDDKVKVYRSPEEVFHPDCISSFEGKPVTDQHPSEGRFVDHENYKELLRGHAQNIRRGGEIDAEGNEALLADLLIQDKDLVREVLEDIKREVSCGYDYKLRLRSDGNFEQYEIRGNHEAVVPKGRAGDKVRINDADPAQQEKESPVAVTKPTGMRWYDYLLGRGLKLHATDATPEETAEAIQGLLEEGHNMAEEKKSLSADDVLRAKDAEIEELKGKLKDAETKAKDSEEEKKAEDEEEHVKGCRCEDCKGMMDKKGKDAKAKDKKAKDKKAKDKPEDKEEEEPKGEDSDDEDEEEMEGEDEEMEGADAKLEPIPDLPAKERPKNPIPGADAATLEVLRITRPIVAKSGDKSAIAAWNRAFDAARPAKKATTRNGYGELANRAGDAKKQATDAEADNTVLTAEDRAKQYQAQLDKANIRAPKGAN